MSAFGIVFTLLGSLMHGYVFWRAASVPGIRRRISRAGLVSGAVALWLVFLLGRAYRHGSVEVLAGWLQTMGMTWMAMLFLMTVCLLAVEVVTGFGLLLSGPAKRMRGMALVAGVVLSLIAMVQGTRAPVVEDYEVRLEGLPGELDGTVIVGLSDLHLGDRLGRQWLHARVDQVRALRPDLVVLLGDIMEGRGALRQDLYPDLARLRAPLGVWAVPGNHETFHRGDLVMSQLRAAGVEVLLNRWAQVRPGLVLAGIEDLTALSRSRRSGDPLSIALAGRPPGATVLLSHTPWQYERAARDGVGLLLSGHTHAGQIWPFGYVVRLTYPLLSGRYEVEGMTVIVCRGTGTWGPRMRLWKPGEIMRVTLRAG